MPQLTAPMEAVKSKPQPVSNHDKLLAVHDRYWHLEAHWYVSPLALKLMLQEIAFKVNFDPEPIGYLWGHRVEIDTALGAGIVELRSSDGRMTVTLALQD